MAIYEKQTNKYTDSDFQETTIYQLELADQYVKHPDIQRDAAEFAIKTYKSILDQKKYSLYLYES
jgi:hypothetical protein